MNSSTLNNVPKATPDMGEWEVFQISFGKGCNFSLGSFFIVSVWSMICWSVSIQMKYYKWSDVTQFFGHKFIQQWQTRKLTSRNGRGSTLCVKRKQKCDILYTKVWHAPIDSGHCCIDGKFMPLTFLEHGRKWHCKGTHEKKHWTDLKQQIKLLHSAPDVSPQK